MADARALLKAERASRRITHPHASYTESGKLVCNLCDAAVKSEAHWQSHLHSTQHNLRSQRRQDAAESRGAGKKRKAEDSESERPPVERKRTKGDGDAVVKQTVVEGEETVAMPAMTDRTNGATAPRQNSVPEIAPPPPPPAVTAPEQPNESDIAADLLALDELEASAQLEDQARLQQSSSQIRDQATISAAPLTAAELAAQAREKQSEQRVKRDEEIEGEREDAARLMEEEMEEMEGLEERVRKLRERREALKSGDVEVADGGGGAVSEEKRPMEDDGGGSEDDDEEDEFDEWKFGGD